MTLQQQEAVIATLAPQSRVMISAVLGDGSSGSITGTVKVKPTSTSATGTWDNNTAMYLPAMQAGWIVTQLTVIQQAGALDAIFFGGDYQIDINNVASWTAHLSDNAGARELSRLIRETFKVGDPKLKHAAERLSLFHVVEDYLMEMRNSLVKQTP